MVIYEALFLLFLFVIHEMQQQVAVLPLILQMKAEKSLTTNHRKLTCKLPWCFCHFSSQQSGNFRQIHSPELAARCTKKKAPRSSMGLVEDCATASMFQSNQMSENKCKNVLLYTSLFTIFVGCLSKFLTSNEKNL